tara:strand:+ start:912 stop:1178 length:267 start_codon:yes stop_codon:yes gene_type:complete
MALNKEVRIDKIEVIGGFKKIGVREATVVSEGSDEGGWTELSRSVHRKVLTPEADVSGESTEVQDIANLVWTDELKTSWSSYVENLED